MASGYGGYGLHGYLGSTGRRTAGYRPGLRAIRRATVRGPANVDGRRGLALAAVSLQVAVRPLVIVTKVPDTNRWVAIAEAAKKPVARAEAGSEEVTLSAFIWRCA